jgi:hypothetical protein
MPSLSLSPFSRAASPSARRQSQASPRRWAMPRPGGSPRTPASFSASLDGANRTRSETLPKPEVLRTTITPDGDGTIVELQVSDGSLLDESPATRITLSIRLGSYELPLLAHLEQIALRKASEIPGELADQIGLQLRTLSGHTYPEHPRPAKRNG